MTVRDSQLPVLALVETDGDPRVSQTAVLVIWELAGSVNVGQLPVLVLNRRIPRRIIGITD